MNTVFYIAAIIALISTFMAITGKNAIHALLYLIISLLAISVIFYILGAPFIAALEVIIYAGAIMVLFIFVIMMLNVGLEEELENKWFTPKTWIIPLLLSLVLLGNFIYILYNMDQVTITGQVFLPKHIGISLFTTYLLGVEISAILLLAGIIGAYHLGRQKKESSSQVFREEIKIMIRIRERKYYKTVLRLSGNRLMKNNVTPLGLNSYSDSSVYNQGTPSGLLKSHRDDMIIEQLINKQLNPVGVI